MHCLSLACVAMVLISWTQNGQSAENQYYGNDFYIGAMRNYPNPTPDKLWLTVTTNLTTAAHSSNSNNCLDAESIDVENITFTVEAGEFSETKNVSALHAAVSIDLPVDLVVGDHSYIHRKKGIHVFTHSKSHYISVVLYNWRDTSVGDYLALPCSPYPMLESNDSQYIYYSLSTAPSTSQSGIWSLTLLVGCTDDTIITIAPSESLLLPIFPQERFSLFVTVPRGDSHSLTLHAGQTLLLGSFMADISGTQIASNKPLSVISGHECSNVPSNLGWCEHLSVQIPPTLTWGNEFLLAPFIGRTNGQYYKAIAKRDLTNVSVTCDGTELKTIELQEKSHDSFFVNSSSYCYVLANKPILLVQLALGGQHEGIGDPLMIIQSPTQQYTNSMIFNVLDTSKYQTSYVNIVTTRRAQHLNVTFDGMYLHEKSWVAIRDIYSNVVGYALTITNVSTGVHTINYQAAGGLMSAVLYGFHINRSYGHTLGSQMNVLRENLFVSFVKPEYLIQENLKSVLIGIQCRPSSFTANTSVIVKTIPSSSGLRDFHPINAMVTCQQGESFMEIGVPIIDDNWVEPVEKFTIVLSAPFEEFDSENNKTVISIIDDDSVDVGFIGDITLTSNGIGMVTVGTVRGQLQASTAIDLKLTVDVATAHDANVAVYHANLNYYVPTLRMEFNLSRILPMTQPPTTETNEFYCTVIASLSADQQTGGTLVFLRDSKLTATISMNDVNNEHTSTSVNEHISTIVNEHTSTSYSVNEHTSTSVNEHTSTSVNEHTSTSVNEHISTSVNEHTSTSVNEHTSTSVTSTHSDACTHIQTTSTVITTISTVITTISPQFVPRDDDSPRYLEEEQPFSHLAIVTLSLVFGLFTVLTLVLVLVIIVQYRKLTIKQRLFNITGVTNPHEIPHQTADHTHQQQQQQSQTNGDLKDPTITI